MKTTSYFRTDGLQPLLIPPKIHSTQFKAISKTKY